MMFLCLFLSSQGGYPCRLRETGEEAQNSGSGTKWLGHHHRHRTEGEHFHCRRCELKYLYWCTAVYFPGEMCWKNERHTIDKRRVESRPCGTRELRDFPPLQSEGLLNFLSHQTQPSIKWCFKRHYVLFSSCSSSSNSWIIFSELSLACGDN